MTYQDSWRQQVEQQLADLLNRVDRLSSDIQKIDRYVTGQRSPSLLPGRRPSHRLLVVTATGCCAARGALIPTARLRSIPSTEW
jgi:hypothetical protein